MRVQRYMDDIRYTQRAFIYRASCNSINGSQIGEFQKGTNEDCYIMNSVEVVAFSVM